MKFGLILLLLLAGVVFRDPHVVFPRKREAPLYGHAATPRPVRFQERPAVKEALLHSDEGALRNEETTLLHVLLERDADPAVLREALSPPSPAPHGAAYGRPRAAPCTSPQPAPTPPPCSCCTAWARGTRRRTEKAGSRWTSFRNWAPTRWPRALPFWENRGNRKAGWS